MWTKRAIVAVLVIATTSLSLADGRRAGAEMILVPARGDATAAPPMVSFDVRASPGSGRRSAGDADLDVPAMAVLDTGASAHLLSHDTAARLDVRADAGARWVETGMSGEHTLGVSAPYTLALGDAPALVLRDQRLLLNDVAATADAILTSPGAVVDVVGMPAIERAVVEIRPSAAGMTADALDLAAAIAALAPAEVTIRALGTATRADHWLPVTLRDFSRRQHPRNRGATPTLAPNPVLRSVRAVRGARTVAGDWLLDTGSAVTIVSTATARALGLEGPAPLSVPLGGISGAQQTMGGWRVDRIELATASGAMLAVTDAAVFVHDVTAIGDDGTRTTLDGLVGANMLDAFARVVLDVPHARVGVDLRPAVRTPDNRRR